jgi:hypothetical protein
MSGTVAVFSLFAIFCPPNVADWHNDLRCNVQMVTDANQSEGGLNELSCATQYSSVIATVQYWAASHPHKYPSGFVLKGWVCVPPGGHMPGPETQI